MGTFKFGVGCSCIELPNRCVYNGVYDADVLRNIAGTILKKNGKSPSLPWITTGIGYRFRYTRENPGYKGCAWAFKEGDFLKGVTEESYQEYLYSLSEWFDSLQNKRLFNIGDNGTDMLGPNPSYWWWRNGEPGENTDRDFQMGHNVYRDAPPASVYLHVFCVLNGRGAGSFLFPVDAATGTFPNVIERIESTGMQPLTISVSVVPVVLRATGSDCNCRSTGENLHLVLTDCGLRECACQDENGDLRNSEPIIAFPDGTTESEIPTNPIDPVYYVYGDEHGRPIKIGTEYPSPGTLLWKDARHYKYFGENGTFGAYRCPPSIGSEVQDCNEVLGDVDFYVPNDEIVIQWGFSDIILYTELYFLVLFTEDLPDLIATEPNRDYLFSLNYSETYTPGNKRNYWQRGYHCDHWFSEPPEGMEFEADVFLYGRSTQSGFKYGVGSFPQQTEEYPPYTKHIDFDIPPDFVRLITLRLTVAERNDPDRESKIQRGMAFLKEQMKFRPSAEYVLKQIITPSVKLDNHAPSCGGITIPSFCRWATRTTRKWLTCSSCLVSECRNPTGLDNVLAYSANRDIRRLGYAPVRIPAAGTGFYEVRSVFCNSVNCPLYES